MKQDKILDADMIIVGAGLSGLLTAWRSLDIDPDRSIILIDGAADIAGDHTWSFNLTDVAPDLRDWIKPFIASQWDDYEVKFPSRKRRLDIAYCTGNSESLKRCVQPHIESGRLKLRLNSRVDKTASTHVVLESGEKLTAKHVLDASGFIPNDQVVLGYQKFVGRTIKTKTPHGVTRPIIMDATVAQKGGYRFVYCLPFSETELLVEDTYYTDGPDLSENEVHSRIEDYIRDNLQLSDHKLIRSEKGVLPITLASAQAIRPPRAIGIRGGFYHAVTGYSFPDALRTANIIAHDPSADISKLQDGHYKSERFFRLLNRMLFRASKPEQRYKVLQRFYGLPEPLIARFYAGSLTWRDKLRILTGKPPVLVTKALYNFSEKAFMKRERQRDSHSLDN